MAFGEETDLERKVHHASVTEQRIRDYCAAVSGLLWQRQAIFLAATVLSVFYFDPAIQLICYAVVLLTEVIDLQLDRHVRQQPYIGTALAKRYQRWILFNTAISSLSICFFVYMIALQQDSTGHFTPLFFLFAAALFGAMNNNQIFHVLAMRLGIYGVTFFAIALLDIMRERPPLSSELWLHFFTVVFVMYFIIDVSFVFMKAYRRNQAYMEELREEHERTKIAYRAKSQFVAVVSHELRTPLTSIKGSLDLVSGGMLGPVPEKMSSVLRIAAKNSERLADLINDILDLQKIEAGEVSYRFAPVDVVELVGEAVDANRGYADRMKIALVADIAPGVTPPHIRGDARRLMQVMSNMISNALKFSHVDGTVEVSYQVIGGMVRILVRDDGVGIPEDAHEKVFGKFTQVDATDERGVGGTGLGMNISKKIIEQHGGRIDYISQIGVGTTFYIDLVRWDETEAVPA